MNADAQEAVLGLLSMGHNYFSQPTPSPATSSATLNSILTTTAPPLIPQKRKQSSVEQDDYPTNQQVYPPQTAKFTEYQPPPTQSPPVTPKTAAPDSADTSSEAVDCICGFAVDDGFSIACDVCSRWCHSACFGIAPGGVPEKFLCWTCKPRPQAERERAVKLQTDRLAASTAAAASGDADGKEAKHRRRNSPGLERKQRRGTTAAAAASPALDTAGPGKRKRRSSIVQPPPTPNPSVVPQTTPNGTTEEEHVDIDTELWKEAYVHIAEDIIPDDDTRVKLRRQATHWRGVTAVSASPNPDCPASPISIRPLPLQSTLNPFLSQHSNPDVLPPAFALHTTQSIPSQSLITPFRACITPSSSYLADPLNAYAHLGMPKPYVHLMGPPFDVALDARIVGNHGRFARWGCRPNAVLRPVLCEDESNPKDGEGSLGFAVFAIRDLKADEEIVLGWEWDDGNAVHSLPALLESPYTFPCSYGRSFSNSQHQLQHLKNQMSNILHALSSTFTTCACGARARDCALTRMAAFVDGHDLGPSLSRRRKERSDSTESDDDTDREREGPDMGPLVGRKRGFKTRERIPHSGGLGGMEMESTPDSGKGRGKVWDGGKRTMPPPLPSFVVSPSSPSPSRKGKERARVDVEMLDIGGRAGPLSTSGSPSSISIHNLMSISTTTSNPSSKPQPPDPPDAGGGLVFDDSEDRMPPKMRKKWMHRELEARKDASKADSDTVQAVSARIGLGITIEDSGEQALMPPPPMPAALDPTTIVSTAISKSASSSPNPPVLHAPEPRRTISPPKFNTPPPRPTTGSPSLLTPFVETGPSIGSPSTLVRPASSSPLTSFANLSLLSPAVTSQVFSQQLTPVPESESTVYPLPAVLPSAEKEIPPPLKEEREDGGLKEKEKAKGPEVLSSQGLWKSSRRGEKANTPTPMVSSGLREVVTAGDDGMEGVEEGKDEEPCKEESQSVETVDAKEDEDGDVEMAAPSVSIPTSDPASSTPVALPDAPSPTTLISPLEAPLPATPASSAYPSDPRRHYEDDEVDYSAPSPDSEKLGTESLSPLSPSLAHTDNDLPPPATGTTTSSVEDAPLKERANSEPMPSIQGETEDLDDMVVDVAPPSLSAPTTETPIAIATTPAPSVSTPTIAPSIPAALSVDLEETAAPPSATPELESPHPTSPVPPRKVKMSLRDFALRKKKQREEMELTRSIQATPSPKGLAASLAEAESGGIEEQKHQDEGRNESEDDEEQDRREKVEEKTEVEMGSNQEEAEGIIEDEAKNVLEPTQHVNGTAGSVGGKTLDVVQSPTVQERVSDLKTASPTARPSPLPSSKPPHPLPIMNGYSRYAHTSSPISPSVFTKPPFLLPPRPMPPMSPITTNFKSGPSRETKQEIIDHPIPPSPASSLPPPTLLQRVYGVERSISPISCDPVPLANRISQSQEEDGEIGEASPPPPPSAPLPRIPHPLPSKRDFSFAQRPISKNGGPPYSRSPPRGPRGLALAYQPRPVVTSQANNSINAVEVARPPPPTGPRALRQSMLSNRPVSSIPTSTAVVPPSSPMGTPTGPPPPSQPSTNGHELYIPRGPSADRDRDRDRDRDLERDRERDHRYPGYRGPSTAGRRGHGWGR